MDDKALLSRSLVSRSINIWHLFAGFPRKLFEGLVASIDSKIQLHALTPDSYNTRAVSTLVSEIFFSSLIELDSSGTGYLHAKDVPRCMGATCLMLDIRLNPDR